MESINTFGDQTSRKLLELVTNNAGFESTPPAPPSNSMRDQYHVQNVVENQAAEAIPAFGLMRVTGISVDGDRYILEVDKPNSDTSAAYLVNGPREIAASGRGVYQNSGNVFVLRTDETSGSVGPGTDWPAVSGAMFQVVGQISSTAPKTALCIRSGPQQITFQAPSGGIPAASGYVAGSATCDILVSDGGTFKDSGQSVVVLNLAPEIICSEGLRFGWAIWDGKDYVALSRLCGDNRTYTAPESGQIESGQTESGVSP